MTVKDDAALKRFRGHGRCPWCGRMRELQPHHLWTRGFGGGTRLDVAFNLIGICAECHQLHHDGHRPLREDLLALVAQRENVLQGDIEAAIYWFQRVPNRSTAAMIRDRLAELPSRARRLVKEVLKGRKAA